MLAVLVDAHQPPDLEYVAEALGGEQADAGPLALEQRVEPDGRPVEEVPSASETVRLDRGCDHSPDRLVDRMRVRRSLPDPDLAGLVVEKDQVRERPSDVDADPGSHNVLHSVSGCPSTTSPGRDGGRPRAGKPFHEAQIRRSCPRSSR